MEGRRGLSPLQGFGQMWQKIFRVRLKDIEVSPTEVIRTWKENFPQFWPKGSRFHAPLTGIAPGEVALLRLVPGGMPLSTGVMVLYADRLTKLAPAKLTTPCPLCNASTLMPISCMTV